MAGLAESKQPAEMPTMSTAANPMMIALLMPLGLRAGTGGSSGIYAAARCPLGPSMVSQRSGSRGRSKQSGTS